MSAKSNSALNADLPVELPDNSQQLIKPENVRKAIGDGYDSSWNNVDYPDLDNPAGTNKDWFYIGNNQLGYRINQATNIPEYTTDGGATWIEIGENIPAIANEYSTTVAMIADQSNQDEGQIFYVAGNGFYYEYLGTTAGTIADYRIQSNGDVRNKALDITARWTFSIGLISEYIYAAADRVRARFRDIINAVNYITLGNSVTGQDPYISAADSVDTNRGIDIRAKGTGKHKITGTYYNTQSTVERALSISNGLLNADYEIVNGAIPSDIADANGVKLDDNDEWSIDAYDYETCPRIGPKGAISSDFTYLYIAIEEDTWIRIDLTGGSEPVIPTLQQVLEEGNTVFDNQINLIALEPTRSDSEIMQVVLDGEGLAVSGDHTTLVTEKGLAYGIEYKTKLEFEEPTSDNLFLIPNITDTAAGLKDIISTLVRNYSKVKNESSGEEQLYSVSVITSELYSNYAEFAGNTVSASGSVLLKVNGNTEWGLSIASTSTFFVSIEIYNVSGVLHFIINSRMGSTLNSTIVESSISSGDTILLSIHSSTSVGDVYLRKRIIQKGYIS